MVGQNVEYQRFTENAMVGQIWDRREKPRNGLVWQDGDTNTLGKAFAKARRAAKLRHWPKNGLRHSFASYHLALHENANALALEMGHTTTKLIYSNYRNLVMPEDAKRLFRADAFARGPSTAQNSARIR
jgi:integrase